MHMLVKLIFIMAAYQHNIARAEGVCGTPNLIPNTVPVLDLQYHIGDSIHIQCAEGYVRKEVTSNLHPINPGKSHDRTQLDWTRLR
uniref:Sushi domain-containing protein n=1 Tax=Sinocyclocheilus anshuiensis TaxID=1608454 RepID=A0A671NRS8_9TELE